MRVRDPEPTDAEGLGRLHARAWQEGYKNGLMPDEFLRSISIDDRIELWAGILARPIRPRSARFVSEGDENQVTGFIMVGPAEGDGDTVTGEVYSLNVDPDFWGQGHGGALLTTATEALRRAGFSDAILWVHSQAERSRRFYEYHGWQPDDTGRTVEVLGVRVPETRYRRQLAAT
jgi:ribosomal protein S18 acetylase RimI-like enzyme